MRLLCLGLLAIAGCSSARDTSEAQPGGTEVTAASDDRIESTADASTAGSTSGTTDLSAPTSSGADDDQNMAPAEPTLSVDRDSETCELDLPFHPPGCPCEKGETASCWTGPPGLRGQAGCQDGVQECAGNEFGSWTECRGEVVECMPEQTDPPPELECGCIPGTVITCSEDCSQLIICSLTGTKVCQPDGTWSACREWELEALEEATFCRSLFFGCLPFNEEGVFVGECGSAFTCGQVPPPLAPPAEVPSELM